MTPRFSAKFDKQIGRKCTNFVKRSTITQKVVCPLSDLGKLDTKSIVMCSHFTQQLAMVVANLLVSSALLSLVGKSNISKRTRQHPSSFASTKTGNTSHGTSSSLQDEMQAVNDETLDKGTNNLDLYLKP